MSSRSRRRLNPKNATILVIAAGMAVYAYLLVRSQGVPDFRDLIATIYYFITLNWGRIPPRVLLLILDVVLLLGGVFLWLVFFAQFILPLRRVRERYAALDRLIVYLAGQSGPTVFVQNGRKIERRGEQKRKGPGLYVLDSVSAGVIRNDVRFKQVVGPGVVFTRKGDYLADPVVDLRPRVQPKPPLGPRAGQDPFAPGDNDDPVYQEIQYRRQQTSALTRDGVEVVPNIMVRYQLARPALEEESRFGFDPQAVRSWVTYKGRQADKTDDLRKGEVPFDYLPAYMAADVWREVVQKFTLQELFTPETLSRDEGATRLALIRNLVQARLAYPQVDQLDKTGHKTGQKIHCGEYELLRKRGIQVIEVVIDNLHFRTLVDKKLVDDWKATWLNRAEAERARIERQRALITIDASDKALLRFVQAAVRKFESEMLDPRQRDQSPAANLDALRIDAADRLVRGTITLCVSDARLVQNLRAEIDAMTDLVSWTRSL